MVQWASRCHVGSVVLSQDGRCMAEAVVAKGAPVLTPMYTPMPSCPASPPGNPNGGSWGNGLSSGDLEVAS